MQNYSLPDYFIEWVSSHLDAFSPLLLKSTIKGEHANWAKFALGSLDATIGVWTHGSCQLEFANLDLHAVYTELPQADDISELDKLLTTFAQRVRVAARAKSVADLRNVWGRLSIV